MRFRTIFLVAFALAAVGVSVRAAGVSIDQSGQQFSERAVSIRQGDNVTFTNRDDVTHNISIINDDEDAMDLGLQKPGQNLSHMFDKDGRFRVRCSIHPGMKMTITVK